LTKSNRDIGPKAGKSKGPPAPGPFDLYQTAVPRAAVFMYTMADMNTRHCLRKLPGVLLCAALLLGRSPCAADGNTKINKISFSGNRVSESTLRAAIPIKEGGELTPEALEKTYGALYAMKLFRSVSVSTSAAGEGLADVNIEARDGWFIFPMPFAASGSGGSSAGVFVFSKNVFRRAESVSVMLLSGGAGSREALFFEKDGRALGVMRADRSADEGLYSDGAFSSAQNMRGDGGAAYLAKYGTLASFYERRQRTTSFYAGLPLLRRGGATVLSGRLAYTGENNDYTDAARQARGGGSSSRVALELNAGAHRERGDDMGALFGLGLADMNKRLQNRARAENRWSGALSLSNAGAWTGADRAFSKASLSVENATVWGGENRLSLRCAAAVSANAPESQLPATGRETGLLGQYAREFRAPRMTAFGASFAKPLSRSRRGTLQASVFAETAFDPADRAATTQHGAGLSLYYRFWRFPLPLGFSQTYSFRDRDFQFSGAIGGRF